MSRPVSSPRLATEVLEEPLFRDVLLREGKRTHRSSGLLALLLVGTSREALVSSSTWQKVGEALTAAKRDTDMMGWLEQDQLIGVILTEITSRDTTVLRAIETRVKLELAKRLTSGELSSLSLRTHVSYELQGRPEASAARVDSVLRSITPPDQHCRIHRILKRSLDIVGSTSCLLVLAPLLVVIAALLKLTSRGPVFFTQERIGEMAKPFKMIKFRTMHMGADPGIHERFVTEFITANRNVQPSTDAPFKLANDPRVTSLGRLLRKTSLDELPQFWNVVRGEMSLVGPRPPLAYELDKYQQWHHRRVFEAKPGITGLWQVTGRSRTTFDDMVRLDLRYAKTRSVWNDIKILLATPAVVASGKGSA